MHVDSLGPSTITRWAEFLNLFVADGSRSSRRACSSLSGALYGFLAGRGASRCSSRASPTSPTSPRPRRSSGRTRACALLMDNGAGSLGPGSIGATWELELQRLAAARGRGRRATTSAPNGALGDKPAKPAPASYTADPRRARRRRCPATATADAWKAQPPYNWAPLAAGKGVGLGYRAAGAGRGHRRPVEPRPLPQVVGAGHRPAGHAQRDPARRQRDLRPERLAARLAPQARCAPVDLDRSRPDAPRARRRAAAEGRFTLVRVPIFAGGPRLPRRLSHPGDDRGDGRRPPALGVRDHRQGDDAQHGRARGRAARRGSCSRWWPARPPRARRCRRRPRCAASRAAPTPPPRTAAERAL